MPPRITNFGSGALAPPARLLRKPVHRGALAGALPQRRLEIDRPVVLAQEIAERLVGELLKIHHAVARQKVERRPGLLVELHPLAGHACSAADCFGARRPPSLLADEAAIVPDACLDLI